jgi:hypothetical protein
LASPFGHKFHLQEAGQQQGTGDNKPAAFSENRAPFAHSISRVDDIEH